MGAHEEHLGHSVHHARSLPGQPASRQAADLARTLKALADPTRLRLVSMVAAHEGREACVCVWAYYALRPAALQALAAILGDTTP
ncbi:MAG TPA: hypothetical protein VHS30_09495 [Streptosporangiaceae bacterium]|nr:hypothetical protein [Streptosporangiaceae bacterium]